jgi:exopolysaccharide biosynthesis protein
MVVSVAEVDLTTPGLSVLTTVVPRGEDVPAVTTSDFAARHGAVVAINAHFFTPFWSRGPFDYYPQAGDPVRPLGLNAADGVLTPGDAFAGTSVWWDDSARLTIGSRPEAPWDAITGRYRLLLDGRVVAPADSSLEPRVALASAREGTRMWLVVVDGRQPGYSEGATLIEMAELARELGANDAIELDGGGSAALVVREDGDAPRPINSPIHTRIPGRERPVATHLGVRIEG